jgi:hypothetical protein
MGRGGGGEEECAGYIVCEGAIYPGVSALCRGYNTERGEQGDEEWAELTIGL